MHKRYAVVAVMAVVWGSACATRSKGAEAGEPETITMESQGAGARDASDCKSGLSISVKLDDAGRKKFDPAPGSDWLLCSTGTMTVTNDLTYTACLVIVDSEGKNAVTPKSVSAGGKADISAPADGLYTLGVCQQKGGDCTSGCANLTDTDGGVGVTDTIKGNLSVVTSG
jgi:hypothetical protein